MARKHRPQKPDEFDPQTQNNDLNRIEDLRFNKELDALVHEAEELRINYMRRRQSRTNINLFLSITSLLAGITAFGWYFLMEAKIELAFTYLTISIAPWLLLTWWASQPLKSYKRSHKTIFMPKMAKALSGLNFYPERGVSAKIINKLAVLPPYNRYEAEDCFMGAYKGVKVIFSEAKLFSKTKNDGPVFNGIFVLLDMQSDLIEGHTIITANLNMAKSYESTRWKNMKKVNITVSNPEWDKFVIYSSENEQPFIGEKLLKELAEAGAIFNNAPLTAVLFGKKYMFIMIPHEQNMFEASNILSAINTKDQARKCKREIEQILEIIDIFDLYKPLQR